MEHKSRASPEQFATILEFMESYGDITRPQQGPQGRIKADRLWQQLEELLNSIGGGVVKPRDKWKKTQPSVRNTLPSPTRDSNCTVCPPQISTTATDEIMLDFIPSGSIQATTSAFTAASSQQHPPPVLTPPPGTTSSPVPSATTPTAFTSQGAPQRQRHQTNPSPSASPTSTPRRCRLLRARTRRVQTPFERATSEFVAVEKCRLQLEADREKNHHSRELERLKIESKRIEVQEKQNEILNSLANTVVNLIEILPQLRPSSLPSTDIIP